MKIDYKTIAIKCDNKAEKLAAIYFLANKAKATIIPQLEAQTLEGKCIIEYPYVYVDVDNEVHGNTGVGVPHLIRIPFSGINNIEKYVSYVEIELNDSYTADVYMDRVEVGCQTIPKEKVKEIWDAMNKLN